MRNGIVKAVIVCLCVIGLVTCMPTTCFNSVTGLQTVQAATKPGKWIKSGTKWWYSHTDGTYTKNNWEYINGKWYFFDKSGWMVTGWKYVDEKWYYLNPSGDMAIGWKKVDGKWYYLNSSGAMKTGWVKLNGYWYYLNKSGVMQTGSLIIGSTQYRLRPGGSMYYMKLGVKRQSQQKSMWCWAASADMIGTYSTNSTINQFDVVRYVKGSTINNGGTDSETAIGIKYASNGTKNAVPNGVLSYSQIQSKIDGFRPMGMHIKWSTAGAHMMVCVGYDLTGKMVEMIDPWENRGNECVSYSALINGVQMASGTGKLVSTVTY